MRRITLLLSAAGLGVASLAAQTVNPKQIKPGTNGQVLVTTGGVTVWGAAAGGGSPVGPTNTLQTNAGGGAFGNSGCTASAGAISCTGAGQGGTFNALEGTAPSAAAGHDIIYGDSTAHCLKYSANGGSFNCIGSLSGQDINYLPKAASATTSTSSSAFYEVGSRSGVLNPFDQYATDPVKWGTTLPGQAQSWAGQTITLTQRHLTGDGGSGAGSTALPVIFNDYYPGYNCGGGYNCGSSGWYLPAGISMIYNSSSTGIHPLFGAQGSVTGSGDIAVFGVDTFNVRNAWITPADEGVNVWRDRIYEAAEYTGTVVSGTTALTLTPISNASSVGIDSALTDTSVVTSGTIDVSSTIGTLDIGTTSFAVPVSTATGTLAGNCNTPAASSTNTGLKLLQTSVTCNFTTSAALSVGDLVDIIGPDRNEVVKLTAVGAAPGSFPGTQSITALMYFSHSTGTTFYANGVVGYYVTATDAIYRPNGKIYVEQLFGSTDAHTVVIGHRDANTWSSFFRGASGLNISMYPGADVVGVINPGTLVPDGAYLAVMPAPSGAFAAGHTVRNTNNISAAYRSMSTSHFIDNPWALRSYLNYEWPGSGGGLNPQSGYATFSNFNDASTYQGAGGDYMAPYGILFAGPVRSGLTTNHPFVGTGSIGVGIDAPGCDTYFLCVGEGLYAGQSPSIGIFRYNANNNFFNYAADTHIFKMQGGGLTVDGGDLALLQGRITSTASNPDTFTRTGDSAFTMVHSALCPDVSIGHVCYSEVGSGDGPNGTVQFGYKLNSYGGTDNEGWVNFYGNATPVMKWRADGTTTMNGATTVNSDLTVTGVAHVDSLDVTGHVIKVDGTDRMYMDMYSFYPYTAWSYSLGSQYSGWSEVWADHFGLRNGDVLTWNTTPDLGLSRCSIRYMCIGNGTAGDYSGYLQGAGIDLYTPASGLFTGAAIRSHASTAATAGVNVSTQGYELDGNYWNGSASAIDTWLLTSTLNATATNPSSTLALSHVGSTGVASVSLPILSQDILYSAAGTALPSCGVATNGFRTIVSDATAPTYMGAYTSGGAVTAEVICSYNGSVYAWATH